MIQIKNIVVKNDTFHNIDRNSFGEIKLNTSIDKNCCSKCKYFKFEGDHAACYTCAYDVIGCDYYYR